ncbi:MAG: hydrogen gas-evolving membrane-bound hydrogenase subunit E, partial [Anaerolineae bacterium]
MSIVVITALPFGLAALAGALRSRLPRVIWTVLTTGLMAGLFGWLLSFLPVINAQGAVEFALEWVPTLGLTFSFYLDGLALLFGLLVTGIGTAIALYTGFYFDDNAETTRFYTLLFAFTGAMLGVVFSGNLITLFIAWELTSITSFLLIGFKGAKSPDARYGAMQALLVTGAGGLALIVGLVLMGVAGGSFELQTLITMNLADHPWYTGMTILIMLGAFTKSAQYPFHFWLPGAMAAPSPASAFLHSATMVKAGVYLLARLYPTLGNTPLWTNTLTIVGLATLLFSSLMAIRKRDLKALLAFTTIGKLGVMVALIGLPESNGLKAAMVSILAHALYKAPMFLIAGVVDHATGTRIIDNLGGLRRQMPGLAVITGLAALSMAGMIPWLGFVAKETLLDAFLGDPLALVVIVVSKALPVAVAMIVFWDVFIREPEEEIHYHDPGNGLLVGPGLLAGAGSVLGLLLPWTIIPLITPAVPKEFELYLFPGFNLPFALSTLAIVVGVLIFLVRWPIIRAQLPRIPTGEEVYQAIVGSVEWSADQLLKTQNGKVRLYLVVILASFVIIMAASGSVGLAIDPIQLDPANIIFEQTDILKLLLLLLAVGATVAAILFREHLLAALAMGVMGYSIGGIFLLEQAPDVALVQFLIETLATVLIILMIGRINTSHREQAMRVNFEQRRIGLVRDGAISVALGFVVMLFALASVTNRPRFDTIATWHIVNAYPLTGVTDVVSSIIADFRGTDTLIEIVVFAMGALGVITLLSAGRGRPQYNPIYVRGLLLQVPGIASPFTRAVAVLILPFALLISITHVLYGGSAPGDGFTAGVISGLGVAVWFVVYGYGAARERLWWIKPGWLITA